MVRLLSCDVIGAADCRDGLALPVHPLEPIQSLSLRVEKTIYQAHDIGNVSLTISLLQPNKKNVMNDR